jgi:hypothetical protein
MRKLAYAAFVGALFTMFGGSLYYLFAMLDAMVNHKSLTDVLISTFFGCLLCWAFFTYLVYQVQGLFDEMNEAGRREREEREEKERRANDPNSTSNTHDTNNDRQ